MAISNIIVHFSHCFMIIQQQNNANRHNHFQVELHNIPFQHRYRNVSQCITVQNVICGVIAKFNPNRVKDFDLVVFLRPD